VRQLDVGSEIGGYRIEAEAGRGGMGIVYKATQLALDRPVALKLIAPELASDEEFRERFKRESRIAASIDDPNVIPVYEAGEEDGLLFITMRFVEGTDLRQLLIQEGRLDSERAAAIIAQVADALDAAHAHGLVHRDIKPGNILIAKRGRRDHAYLTDFGLTKHRASKAGLTKTGTWVGTLDYVAPEQIQGGEIDGRTDVYALGCVLYQCLAGQVPFERDSDIAKIWAHIADPPRPLREIVDVAPPLEYVVAKAMAKEPSERFDTAGDFGRAAAGAADGRAGTPAPPPRAAPAPPPPPSAAGPLAPPPPSGPRPAAPPPPSGPHRPAPPPPRGSPAPSSPQRGRRRVALPRSLRGLPGPPPSSPPRGTPAPPPSPPRGTPAPPPSSPPRGTPAPPPSSPPRGTPAPPPSSPPRGTPAPPPSAPRGTPPPPPPPSPPRGTPAPPPSPPRGSPPPPPKRG
jgi:serine/threonine protein kinase